MLFPQVLAAIEPVPADVAGPAAMAEDEQSGIEPRSFLACVTEMAQLLGVGDVSMEPKGPQARHLAHAVRKPLLERASLPEKWFAPLMAAAVDDPDPSFCRWFVEPAVYGAVRDSKRPPARSALLCHFPVVIMYRMRFFPATADSTALDRAAAYPADGPITALTAERIREELRANQFRPEWVWLAEDENGHVLARALWWGRADSERPIALDCLQIHSTVADPVAVATTLLDAGHAAFGARPLYNLSLPADWSSRPELSEAVAWRREAGLRAGLSREIQRLRYEWTPAAGLPEAGGRLTFREGSDEEFLEAFVRVSGDSLDQATRDELRTKSARQLAEEDMRFYLDCPGERSWWRLAELPDGTLAGLAVPSATPYNRNVGYLGVVPEQRGRGLIDEILAEITRFHATERAERITATTDTTNVPMAAAFDRANYEVTEIRMVLEAPGAA